MGNLIDIIKSDVRYEDSLKACMNCGICTAICPAAEFYDYDPRRICDTVQRGDEEQVEKLLRSDTIWYCGQCMSCKPRCPRGNVPGAVINILRKVSQEMGYYKESRMGRQQTALMAGIGNNILEIGYCVHPDKVPPQKKRATIKNDYEYYALYNEQIATDWAGWWINSHFEDALMIDTLFTTIINKCYSDLITE